MSDLKESVKAAIESYVYSKKDTHTQLDVLRMIKDQAALLFERQAICDALDSDPMQQLQDVRPQVERIKNLMEVVSCSRVVTLDGYARNDALIEWKRDDAMKGVTSNVLLTFHYEQRRKCSQQEKDGNSRVGYTIDVARDFGEKQRLLVIEVFALGDGPSSTPAEPLDEEEWEDAGDDDNGDTMESDEVVRVETVQQQENGENKTPTSDRFSAYFDPDALSDLLEWTQLGMDEYTTFFFLMTFPFYEHEWDLVGFAVDAVFGEAMEEDASDSSNDMSAQQEEQDDNANDDDNNDL